MDLRKMDFITSLACVAFLGLKATVRDVGGRLLLCNMSEFVQKGFFSQTAVDGISPHRQCRFRGRGHTERRPERGRRLEERAASPFFTG